MDPIVFIAMLASAFLHAFWHASARTRPDPGDSMVGVVIAASFWGALAMIWLGPPPLSVWPWIGAAAAFNVVIFWLLLAAYDRTAFVVAYPASRAAVAPMVLAFAFVAFGEWPRPAGLAGILFVCAAVAALGVAAARRSRVDVVGLLLALASAAVTGAYAVVDAYVVRESGVAFQYAAGATVTNATCFLVVYTLQGRRPLAVLRRESGFALMTGAISTTSYFLLIWSMQHAPIASVVTMRETSVFFSIAIAALWLREKVERLHWVAGLLAVAGIALIRLG